MFEDMISAQPTLKATELLHRVRLGEDPEPHLELAATPPGAPVVEPAVAPVQAPVVASSDITALFGMSRAVSSPPLAGVLGISPHVAPTTSADSLSHPGPVSSLDDLLGCM